MYDIPLIFCREDAARVIHTDGSKLIAIGSQDRKVRFINNESGKDVPPVMFGHAGSIRCVAVNEKKRYVLSGSYDTSIR